jgi:hypothetical protein
MNAHRSAFRAFQSDADGTLVSIIGTPIFGGWARLGNRSLEPAFFGILVRTADAKPDPSVHHVPAWIAGLALRLQKIAADRIDTTSGPCARYAVGDQLADRNAPARLE